MNPPLLNPAPRASALAAVLGQRPDTVAQRIARIPVAPEQQDLLGYERLREAAIVLAQAASRSHWTDYNLHDPGVTLLEAFCYALTEDVYASRQSVPALLGLFRGDALVDEATSRIPAVDLAQFAMHGAPAVLSCRPSTAHDYQRWLYDRWPQARHLQMRPLCDSHQRPTGLWQISRQVSPADAQDTAHTLAPTRAYWGQRNLGEDLLDPQLLLKPRWVRLRMEIRVDGKRDLADLLAELLKRCDDTVSARPERSPLTETPDAQRSGGPLMQQGWASDAELAQCYAAELRFSDMALDLRDIAGVLKVEHLVLEETPALSARSELAPLEATQSSSLPLRGEGWALRMAWPASPQDLEGWCVYGQGSNDLMPLHQLWQQLEDVRRTPRREALPALPDPVRPASERNAKPATPYVPASSHLPGLYHAQGTRRNPQDLQPTPQGQRQQWHAYLALLEQWLAHSRAQRQHLGALFDIGRALGPSYWWDLPGKAQLPGLESTAESEGVYRRKRDLLERDIFEPADAAPERRNRVLDQLLAMHGEQLDFDPLQGLPCYWSSGAWERHLLRCKRRFARQLLPLTGQRNAAFNYSRPVLGRRDNLCPLGLRLALMLGMGHPFTRLLTLPLQSLDLQLLPDHAAEVDAPAQPQAHAPGWPLHLVPTSHRPLRGAALRRMVPHLRAQLPLLCAAVPPALLRSAVHADRFFLQDEAGHLALCLRGEGAAQHWVLARVANQQKGQQLATDLHQFACAVQRQAEGLHLVEHLLLRPALQPADALAAFHRQRLSMVLPAWTARCADPRFQTLCRSALAMHAPAHLESRVLFLDSHDMRRFEQLYAAWLEAKRAACQHPPTPGRPRAPLDACAAALSQFLQPFWSEGPQP